MRGGRSEEADNCCERRRWTCDIFGRRRRNVLHPHCGPGSVQNPISATHNLKISDDKDNVRLRILAEQHTFKVGDDAKIRVHWRQDPALALITYQGARVLGYRLVQLARGENKIDLSMTALLAPNFDFTISVMTDVRAPDMRKAAEVPRWRAGGRAQERIGRRFHEVSSPFTVVRAMNVSVAVKGKAKSSRVLKSRSR